MALLKRGDRILLDFDGELVESKYPEIGNVREGMREFLDHCKLLGIDVFIWTARGNRCAVFPNEKQCFNGLKEVNDFLIRENLYFTGIYTGHKPIGEGQDQFNFLMDDKAAHFYNGWAAKSTLFGN